MTDSPCPRSERRRPMLDPTVYVTRYEVSLLPRDDVNYRDFVLMVGLHRDGSSWVVTDGVCWLGADLTFHDRIYRQCLHDKETALRLAKQAAPHVRVNRWTAADAFRERQTKETPNA